MKVCTVVGARPNFVKEYLVNSELKKRGIDEVLVHTGQHYDYEMSQVFFDCFALPAPDYNLQIANNDNVAFTAQAMVKLASVFDAEHPDCVLGYGDVNSTLAAAIAASKLRIPFVHVEGGIRSTDRYNPEEINRRVSDVLADLILCCTQNDVANLENEGFRSDRIEFTGDLMYDVIVSTIRKYEITLSRGDYDVLTLHREENLTDKARLSALVEGLIRTGRKIIFPAHPRTLKFIENFGLLDRLDKSAVQICTPMGYVDFVRLAAGANKILTDSGGVRREAYFLRKPCIVLIELSWFPSISQAGWKVLTGPDPEQIAHLINTFEPSKPYKELFGDGTAHQKIVERIINNYVN